MLLHVKVIPNAKQEKREQKKDLLGNTIYKIWLTVPPLDGKANEALIKFLSKQFNVTKWSITIVRGQTSKLKIIEIKST
jgi:uncharacterized protein